MAKAYRLTREDKLRADVIMRLMCDLALDFRAMGQKWAIDFEAHFAEGLCRLQEAASDGLVEWVDSGLEVTEKGLLYIRNLAMCFDAYVEDSVALSGGCYSATV